MSEQILAAKVKGMRKIGRPCQRWTDEV